MFNYIAAKEGSLYSVWGPCTDGSKMICDCPQCQHANQLEADGKDWDIEYQNAKTAGFKTLT